MRGQSSWLTPGGEKRAQDGALSRGFIGSWGFWGIEGLGCGLVPLPCPQGGLGCCLFARAIYSEVTGYAEIPLGNTQTFQAKLLLE